MKDASHNKKEGYDDVKHIAAPGSPAAGYIRTYAKSDGLLYQKTSAGLEGVVGVVADGYRLTFSTTTTDSDPGNGVLRLSNATQSSATRMTVDSLDILGSSLWNVFVGLQNYSLYGLQGFITLQHATDATKWSLWKVTDIDDGLSGYFNLTVEAVTYSSASPFSNNDLIVLRYDPTLQLIPAGLLTGTTTNDDAAAGKLGEYITATLASGSAVSLVNSTAKTVTSISLTAGDWDVTGVVVYSLAASTSTTLHQAAVSLTTNTLPTNFYDRSIHSCAAYVPGANAGPTAVVPVTRISVAGTTTVYLIASMSFSVSTATAYGFVRARRVR